MARDHIYLISSLPLFQFGARPPFSFVRFLEICRGLIPDVELDILAGLELAAMGGFAYEGMQPTLKGWYDFETSLRNELAKIRSSRKKIDSAKYLRRESYAEPYVTHLALAAYRSLSILDGEKILDEGRWNFLDGLCTGHYFDIDFLIVYAQKLLILERWDKVRLGDKDRLLDEALA